MNARDPFNGARPADASAGAERWSSADAFSRTSSPDLGDEASTSTVLRELMHELPALLGDELALARSEMRANLEQARRGAAAVSAGGIVLAGGCVMLLFAAMYALSYVLVPWAAAAIVGVIALLIGYAMVRSGMKQASAHELMPDRTMDSLRKDTNAIRGARNDYH